MTVSFTHDDYRRLIRRTRDAYPIRGFEVLDSGWGEGDEFAILRHDIDVSPARALSIAKIEASEGVRATYTVLLTSEFYNPLDERTRASLRTIADLGHDLGLHFDAQWQSTDTEEGVHSAVAWQAAILEQALEVPIRCFSFHNTTPFTMGCHASHYGGRRNAYAGKLQREVTYVSDSNGMWRYRTWDEMLDEDHPRCQVLTHADWWTPEALSPAQKICTELEERSREVWHYYCEFLEKGDKRNECDIAELIPALRQIDADAARLWLAGYQPEALLRISRHLVAAGASDPRAHPRSPPLELILAGTPLNQAEARQLLDDVVAQLTNARTQ